MNNKVLQYIADLMGKVYSDSIESIVKFILNLEHVDRNKLMPMMEGAYANLKGDGDGATAKVTGITKRINDLKTLEKLIFYLNAVNDGSNK